MIAYSGIQEILTYLFAVLAVKSNNSSRLEIWVLWTWITSLVMKLECPMVFCLLVWLLKYLGCLFIFFTLWTSRETYINPSTSGGILVMWLLHFSSSSSADFVGVWYVFQCHIVASVSPASNQLPQHGFEHMRSSKISVYSFFNS